MTTPGTHDAREGSGDPTTDPAAAGERAVEHPDADGGADALENGDEQGPGA